MSPLWLLQLQETGCMLPQATVEATEVGSERQHAWIPHV